MKPAAGLIVFAFVIALGGCATARPVLYPNEHLQNVGQAGAERDIADCKALAEAAGADTGTTGVGQAARGTIGGAAVGAASGAVGGAVVGSAGAGSAIGAASGAVAGLIRSLFGRSGPDPTYRAFVNRCLQERGYDVVGWD
ncbi:glycine zipper family protein [Methylocaldum szegediense]|mgnify:CR=1 FL=1|uniref:OmpA family protein n=1 Tax=Methylocaldum szegediense TaxID=73780 RepID=A0ABM9I4N9_9GAMM|nr:glycine zipper family protein [Methylocaldum szegediense]CAI8890767.1 OmpA family protein [Methylocaldum szegediense]